MTDQLTPLELPVPPLWEGTLGYLGDAPLVAFYWTPGGDELMYQDPWCSGTGDWRPWLLWRDHESVRSSLEPFDFGCSEAEAQHWLLLERRQRRFYAGTPEAVRAVFGALPEVEAQRTAWQRLSTEERRERGASAWGAAQRVLQGRPSRAEVLAAVQEARSRYDALAAWLELHRG